MENKILKDFVITLSVLILLGLSIFTYLYSYRKITDLSEYSKFKNKSLSEELLRDIKSIEASIRDRKTFRFTVEKDPLEQNLIVKTKKDIYQQWVEDVRKMVRLASTLIDENGEKVATIAHEGQNKIYKIGDTISNMKITDIKQGVVEYVSGNRKGILELQKIPPFPEEIRTKKTKNVAREINW